MAGTDGRRIRSWLGMALFMLLPALVAGCGEDSALGVGFAELVVEVVEAADGAGVEGAEVVGSFENPGGMREFVRFTDENGRIEIRAEVGLWMIAVTLPGGFAPAPGETLSPTADVEAGEVTTVTIEVVRQ